MEGGVCLSTSCTSVPLKAVEAAASPVLSAVAGNSGAMEWYRVNYLRVRRAPLATDKPLNMLEVVSDGWQ